MAVPITEPITPAVEITDDKHFSEHHEAGHDKLDRLGDAAAKGQLVSGYESLSVWQTVQKFKMAFLVCFAATFAASTDGYQIGMNGNLIANSGFIAQFATTTDSTGAPILAASVLTAIGTIHAHLLIHRVHRGEDFLLTHLSLAAQFGRKPAMFALWLILACSVLCESLARHWQVWFVAKLFSGIGVGSLQFITPTYVSEVAPPRIRGMLLVLYNFWFSLGSFFASIALQVMFAKDPLNYRTPIYTQWGHIGLMLIIYLIIPETPAWYASKGKEQQAKKALRLYEILVAGIEHEREFALEQKREKWYSIFRGVDGFRTIVSTWALFSQQLLGLTLFYTYSSYFFSAAGFNDPFAVTCITNAIQLVTILAVVATVDRFGRRNIACGGLTTMLVGILLIGIMGVIKSNKATNALLVLFSCVYMIGLQCSGSTGWGYVGEISSQRLRAHTAGFAAALSCVMGVVMNVLVPYMLSADAWNWGLKTAFFYLGIGAPFAIASWFIIPETTGKTSAELDELFEAKVRPWRFHKTKTALQRAVEAQAGL
ncbi:hypothetical protein EHS25_002199 [Saitozyma podzolica]|uniref:Major facilitator superfamily (MFS) profile domain-containing protein n=1 Tax=Saitozyma podzolica TaxID=1890683 RepID=A0A427YEY4_9TREE|nr:hypothetical protein EHS25_002199 [Saitozyma podzolica]